MTGCAIQLQKQPAVPFRHENVRYIFCHKCISNGKRKTTYRAGSFQQQKKDQANEILRYKVKDKFTDNLLQYQHYVTANEYFKTVIYIESVSSLLQQFCLRFLDLPQQAIHAVILV